MTGINWRDAVSDPPTADDLDVNGCVATENRHSTFGVVRGSHPSGKWCPVRELKAHIESTLNPAPPDSPWVYAKDRMPTKEDGKHVLWMADSWTRPVIHPFYALRLESSRYHRHNLRWCRIPPCPPPPKRELPAVSIDIHRLPVRFTMRDGSHWTALDESMNVGVVCIRKNDGGLQSFMVTNSDIVHVGGWLTAEELEAKRNET